MKTNISDPIWKLLGLLYKPHPWHGISIGNEAPEIITTFIEIVPTDTVKYEVDKISGYLKVDRPQRYSNVSPTMYGFIPQTFCAEKVAEFCIQKTGKENIIGDGDPLDICVLTEKTITQGNIILKSKPIGGIRMIDGDEADDKIISVLKNDAVYDSMNDVNDIPEKILDRLTHYFLTYKEVPGKKKAKVEIADVYGKEEAYEVIRRSQEDYEIRFGKIEEMLTTILRG